MNQRAVAVLPSCWVLLVLSLLGAVVACEEGALPVPAVESETSGMAWRVPGARTPALPARGSQEALPGWSAFQMAPREIARQKQDRAADPCGRCFDRACELSCLLEDELLDGLDGAALVVNCIACGRETGFLPQPILDLERLGAKSIVLSWAPVEGATRYSVYGLGWQENGGTDGAQTSFTWQTEGTRLHLTLEEGHSYLFQLIAWADEPAKLRSQPSEPVGVEL